MDTSTSTVTSKVSQSVGEIEDLREKVKSVHLPPDLLEKVNLMIDRAATAVRFSGYFAGIEQVGNYVDLITHLPWFKRSDDLIDINQAQAILEKNHYGLREIKDRILEYISVLKLSKAYSPEETGATITDPSLRAPILLLIGLVGVGKTTFAISIAEAMGRKFIRIPFGGLGSAKELRGQSRAHADAEPGLIVKALRRAGTKNPVILLDELDRVTEDARADIMGVLVELMDPQQNSAFTDHYLDYPFNLSEVLFIATANNTKNIAPAVMDRFEPISMPSYTDAEKITIAKDYMLPKVMQASGLSPEQLVIQDNTWPVIVRPLGYDAGMRTMERTIISICRHVARLIIEGKGQQFVVTPETVKNFIHADLNIY